MAHGTKYSADNGAKHGRYESRLRKLLAGILSSAVCILGGAAILTAGSGSGGKIARAADPGKGLGPENRYECEDAKCFDGSGKKKIGNVRVSDKKASGGATAGSTGGKYFLFENTPEANVIHIAYATHNTSTMQALIRYPDAEDYIALCVIDFSTSNSWEMSSSYIAVSPVSYIPEGSDIMIKPSVDVNLDYLYFTLETAVAGEIPEGTVGTGSFSKAAEEDPMAPYGKCVRLTEGQEFTAKVDTNGQFNVITVNYSASEGASLTVTTADGNSTGFTLPSTPRRSYFTAGIRLGAFKGGETLTFKVTGTGGAGASSGGELRIASFTPAYAPESTEVNVGKLPSGSERLTVLLDGIWDVCGESYSKWEVPETMPQLSFADAVPVPGLWGDAAYSLGNYSTSRMWLSRTIVLEEEPSGQVLLKIGSAMYGRYVYVNGTYAGGYEYNYSSSVTDITGLLHKGENRLVIMLGSYANQNNNSSTPAHVLTDGESSGDEPGITDSVELIFNAGAEIDAIQTAPDIDNGTVTAKVRVLNRKDNDIVTDVTLTLYELGRYVNGKPESEEVRVGEYTFSGLAVAAGGSAEFTAENVALSNWSKDKCWTPENPYLYRIEVKTSGDTYSVRFGMRTFCFESGTGMALLNGERRYLFGTNVAIERYFDDELCGTTPWDDAWIRKLYSEYRSINWTCFRTHLGHANSKWFDIADEVGMMIFDEYPIWGNAGDDTIKTITPEIYRWIDDRGNHPSLIVFDAQNEATYNLTDKMINAGREYDIQHRPWDNGWRAPVGDNDPIECHPYILGGSGITGIEDMTRMTPVVTTIDLGWKESTYKGHAFILNEHGEYWINREGKAMSATEGRWNGARPGMTDEERLTYYCDLMVAQLEAFRAGRAYSGLLFFCGLTSSSPSALGVTGDVLEPDVSSAATLSLHPYFKYLMENTNAPLGIVIDTYIERRTPGKTVSVPVKLINDTNEAVNDLPVTLVVRSSDEKVLWAERRTVSVAAFSPDNDGTATEFFELTVPAYKKYCEKGSELLVQAFYTLDGKTVFSQRKWEMKEGTLTGDKVPEYSWLDASELPHKYVREEYLNVDDGEGGESGNQSSGRSALKTLLWVLGGTALVSCGVAAGVIIHKKKTEGK